MSNKKNILTQEGFDNFSKELEYLKGIRRAEVAQRIQQAKDYGDLSENAEYDAAKEEQAMLEQKIYEIENLLKNVEIIEVSDDNNISVGKTVAIEKLDTSEKFEIKVVGNNESSYSELKISIASPLGKSLLDKTVNDVIDVTTPEGILQYKILSVKLS